jgi:hypothetical protein
MNRKLFIQKSILLLAFASTYNYTKANNLLVRKPDENFDFFFTKIKKLSIDYFNENINDDEWRIKIDELYTQHFLNHNIKDFRKYIDFRKLKKQIDFASIGRGKVMVNTPLMFKKDKLILKTQLIGIQKGYAIPPHIHENMSSCSLILEGKMAVSHYNRIETHKGFVIVEKDSENYQEEGDWSTVSPIKNNLHWFKSYKEDSYMLNINVEGLNNQKSKPGIRVDITQESNQINKFKATIISEPEAQLKYGRL